MSYLTQFIDLNALYIHDNPCLFVTNDRYGCHQPFDYRPFILNWCLGVQNLDGTFITRKERLTFNWPRVLGIFLTNCLFSLKAEWLLSQGKGRSFRPGDHMELVQYLIKVCGTDADEVNFLHTVITKWFIGICFCREMIYTCQGSCFNRIYIGIIAISMRFLRKLRILWRTQMKH